MSGNAKIGIAAATLCAVMLFVLRDRDIKSAPATLDGPLEHELAMADVTLVETELVPVPPEQPKPDRETEAVPPPVEPVVAKAKVATPPAPVEPPDEVLPPARGRIVKRKFTLEIQFDRKDAIDTQNLPDGTIIATSLDWSHKQDITITDDVRESMFEEADFVRLIKGNWRSDIDVRLNVNEQGWQRISRLKAKGSTPLEKRKLIYHFDQEQGWVITPKNGKIHDPPDLTQGLRAELDLKGFKPPPATFPGDRWAVEGDPLIDLFQPGGDLRVHYKRSRPDRADAFTGLEEALVRFETPKGQLIMTSTGVGTKNQRATEDFSAEMSIGFVNEVELDQDQTATSGFEAFQQRFEFEGKGDGSWDSEAGFISDLSIKGDVTIVRTMKQVGSNDQEGRFRGKFELTIENTMK